MKIAIETEAAGAANQDCVAAYSLANGTVLALADGAGGMSGGGEAARHLVSFVAEHAERLSKSTDGRDVASVLRAADSSVQSRPECGETTAVVAVVVGNTVFGASVGDSETWLVDAGRVVELTANQHRRPFVGTGSAEPVVFGPTPFAGRLIVGSDGLFKYATRRRILDTLALAGSIDEAAIALVAAPRLPSGAYPDDVSVILCGNA